MVPSFSLEKIQQLMKDFYCVTGIRITLFDNNFQEIASYPKDIAPFCQIIRTDPEGEKRCLECDRIACRTASHQRSLHTYRCHAGLTESITPLYVGNVSVGYLFFGHLFSFDSHEAGWDVLQEKSKDLSIDHDLLRQYAFEMPLVTEEYITSASHLSAAIAALIYLDRVVSVKEEDIAYKIDEYIGEHFTEDITAVKIADRFGIGKTQLYNIAKEQYGKGIAEHIRNLRIEKAKQLLEEGELSLAYIAYESGFQDYNYFITVFKKVTGTSPMKYREIHKNEP